MMRTIDRFTNDELPVDRAEAGAMRLFFHRWADEVDRVTDE